MKQHLTTDLSTTPPGAKNVHTISHSGTSSHALPRERDALRAAQLYYLQHLTMEAISKELAVSRSTVSRLLAHARRTGLVTIEINAVGATPPRRSSKNSNVSSKLM